MGPRIVAASADRKEYLDFIKFKRLNRIAYQRRTAQGPDRLDLPVKTGFPSLNDLAEVV